MSPSATPIGTPVCSPFTDGKTIGYWKTHTGLHSPTRDSTYDNLPVFLGISPEDGPPEASVDTVVEALGLLKGATSSGTGISMLRAQLLAAKLNTLKYPAFDDAYFPDGQKVGDVMAQADQILDDLAHGIEVDKGTIVIVKDLLDQANNNGEGQQVLRTCNFPPPTVPHSLNDYDGDGFSNEDEGWHIGTNASQRCGPGNWPADLYTTGTSQNKLDIQDLVTFIAPLRRLDTSPGEPGYDDRWNLVPDSALGPAIGIVDLAALVAGDTAHPPMFNGARAFGRSCQP